MAGETPIDDGKRKTADRSTCSTINRRVWVNSSSQKGWLRSPSHCSVINQVEPCIIDQNWNGTCYFNATPLFPSISLFMTGSTLQLTPSALDLDTVPVSANTEQGISSSGTQKAFETLIHRIHHDLNGPLASISGLAQIARMEQELPAVLNHLDTIHRLSNKLTGILEELLEVNHIHSEAPRPHWIEVAQELDLAVSGFSEWPEARGINITLEGTSCALYVDPNRLRSALSHLLSNAIIHHDVNKSERWIQVRFTEEDDQMKIEVVDNGKGIEKEFLDRVFDMFAVGEQKSGGSGLGLYLTKEVVGSMGGQLQIESERGRGTIATIYFPIEKHSQG